MGCGMLEMDMSIDDDIVIEGSALPLYLLLKDLLYPSICYWNWSQQPNTQCLYHNRPKEREELGMKILLQVVFLC